MSQPNQNEHQKEETEETEAEKTESSGELNKSNESAATAASTTKTQIKWKPLMIDTPKRERKPYRASTASNKYRKEAVTASAAIDSSVIPPHTQGKQRNNPRAKSLDRQQQPQEVSSKKTETKSTKSKLNKSTINNPEMISPNQRHHSTTTATTTAPGTRPLKFERATAAAKQYRTNQKQQNKQLPRENSHKDYLYGDEALIVEEMQLYQTPIYYPIVDPANLISLEAMPATAVNVSPIALAPIYTEQQIKELLRRQIEYYFSDENLERDLFLRRQMDALGYIPLSVIASFNRVKLLSLDFDLIVESLRFEESKLDLTPVYDASTGKIIQDYLVRCKINPTKWSLYTNLNNSLQHVEQQQQTLMLNPNVAEFVPRFNVNEEELVVQVGLIV
jgi:hypothetical protein